MPVSRNAYSVSDYSRKPHRTQMASTSDRSAIARPHFDPLANILIVGGGYLFSRVLGLAREVIISQQFGTSPAMDAYRATFLILDLIYLIVVGGALGSAFIPIFSGFLTDDREKDAWRLANSVLNLAMLA